MANREEILARLQQIEQQRKEAASAPSTNNSEPIGRLAPTISTKGPDLQVLAGREDRAFRRATKVNVVNASLGSVYRPQSAGMRMSDADLDKLARSTDEGVGYGPDRRVRNDRGFILPGDTLKTKPTARTAGEMRASQATERDAYRSQLRSRMASDPRAIAARSRIQAENTARKDAYEPRTVQQRVPAIASTLRPGDHIGIKEGNQTASGTMKTDGTFDVQGFTSSPGTKISAGPGKVKNDAGEWVPIGAETARIGKPFKEAGERANVAANETAAYMRRIQDDNPAVQAKRATDAYVDSRNNAATPTVAAPASQDPYRRKIASVTRQPRASSIQGARYE